MSGTVLRKRRPQVGQTSQVAPRGSAVAEKGVAPQDTYWSLWYRARSLPCLRFSLEGLQDYTAAGSDARQERGSHYGLTFPDGKPMLFRCRTQAGQRRIDQLLRLRLGGQARPERRAQVSYWSEGWLYFWLAEESGADPCFYGLKLACPWRPSRTKLS